MFHAIETDDEVCMIALHPFIVAGVIVRFGVALFGKEIVDPPRYISLEYIIF